MGNRRKSKYGLEKSFFQKKKIEKIRVIKSHSIISFRYERYLAINNEGIARIFQKGSPISPTGI
jgi:hypothetical protein